MLMLISMVPLPAAAGAVPQLIYPRAFSCCFMPLAALLVCLSNGTWLTRESHVVRRDDGERVSLEGTRPPAPTPFRTGFLLSAALNQKGCFSSKFLSCLSCFIFFAFSPTRNNKQSKKHKQRVLFPRPQTEGEDGRRRSENTY